MVNAIFPAVSILGNPPMMMMMMMMVMVMTTTFSKTLLGFRGCRHKQVVYIMYSQEEVLSKRDHCGSFQ